jgi:hypothetical protein
MALTDKLTAIADAIRGKTGKTDGLTLDQMAAEIAGIEAGGGGENLLDYAGNLQYAFQKTNFGGIDFAISFGAKAGMIYSNAMDSVFRNATGMKSLKISCGFGTAAAVSFANFLRSDQQERTLKTLDLSGAVHVLKPTNISRLLDYKIELVDILGEIDMSSCTNTSNAFQSVSNLETIRFKAGTLKVSTSFNVSSKLTDATIQNIIDGLADLTGSTAQTLTLHATVGAKLTDAQKSVASAKNWTISY